jgi:hypothetical protein
VRRLRLIPYHRLIALVVAVNAAVFAAERGSWRIADGSALRAFGTLTLINLAVAVLIRQQRVLNVLFDLAGRVSPAWPLKLRWAASQVNHVGGIHVGAALAGTVWLCAFTYAAATGPGDAFTRTVAYALAALAVLIVLCALPPVRARAHNVFENTHRFGGWSAVGLFWLLMLHVGDTWQICVMIVMTASIAAPWLHLRRVPVTVERPSAHAAIVSFDYGVTPTVASAVGISVSPLREWHPFATVTTPGESGYRLLVSRAGDWTARFIDSPPSHVWVRGIPTAAPMAKVETNYKRVIYVVTGSGIGPALGQILAANVPARLVWSVRSPRTTYGDALVDEVQAAQPDALIWDTTTHGKPDLVELARDAYRDFDAEAVFVVSNKTATWRVVKGMERLGIPAFGPIWDS